MYPIKKSAAQPLLFFLHDANGDAVTGKADGSFTKRISKNGSTTFSPMTVTITEAENGWYGLTLSTSHTDTLGILSISFLVAGAKQVNLQFRVESTTLSDILDAQDGVETGLTPRQALRLISAVLAGDAIVSGTNVTFRNAVADSKNRIVVTVDGSGNRTFSSIDPT